MEQYLDPVVYIAPQSCTIYCVRTFFSSVSEHMPTIIVHCSLSVHYWFLSVLIHSLCNHLCLGLLSYQHWLSEWINKIYWIVALYNGYKNNLTNFNKKCYLVTSLINLEKIIFGKTKLVWNIWCSLSLSLTNSLWEAKEPEPAAETTSINQNVFV